MSCSPSPLFYVRESTVATGDAAFALSSVVLQYVEQKYVALNINLYVFNLEPAAAMKDCDEIERLLVL